MTAKQCMAVEALQTTGEVGAAAWEAGIHRDTLHRWLKQPVFAQTVRQAEAQALDDLTRLLVGLGRTAVVTPSDRRCELPILGTSGGCDAG